MNEIKILSIDFDIIMYHCLNLYNDKVFGNLNPTQSWNNLNNSQNIRDIIYYDAHVYNQIFQLVIKNIQLKHNLTFFINSHEEIINILKENDLYDDYIYDLLNIDFHHDVLYSKNQYQQIKDFDKYNCADWVGYLFHNNKIVNYTWLTSANSQDFQLDNHLDFLKDTIKINKQYLFNLNDLLPEYDYIFICLSPQWVPPECQHLYILLKDICNIIYKDKKND